MNKSTTELLAAIRPSIAKYPDDVVPQSDREELLSSIVSTAVIDEPRRRTPVYRRPTLIGAAVAGMAAAVLAAIALVPSGSTPTGRVTYAAYVVNQLARTLTNAGAVVHFQETVTAGGTTYVDQHWYRLDSGLGRMTTARADGTQCTDATITGLGPLPGDPNGPGLTIGAGSVVTGLNDADHTWWTFQGLPDYLHTPACSLTGPDDLGGYSQLLEIPLNVEQIKQDLTEGQLHIVRSGAVVNGQRTIELNDDSSALTSGTAEIWVNDTTYQLVRSIVTGKDGSRRETNYEFLSPTATNIAALRAPVPPGFRRVAPPTDFDTCPSSPCQHN